MAAGWVDRSAWLDEAVLAGLYGRHGAARGWAADGPVPAGACAPGLCRGPAVLFDRDLRREGVGDAGLDINPGFVAPVEVFDLGCGRHESSRS